MKVSDQVERILKYSRQARNSDKELLIEYMQASGMHLTPQQVSAFRDLPSMETIRRIRQKFQENGQYIADQPVKATRYFGSLRTQQVIPSIQADKVEQLVEPKAIQVGLEI